MEPCVAWICADQVRGRPGVLIRQAPGAPGRYTFGDAKGLEVSLCCFRQDHLVQGEIRDRLA